MTIAALKPAFERSRAADQPVSQPPACYVDDAVTQAEIAHLFRGGWFGAGRADQVKEADDYVALDVAGQPIILLHDKAGSLQAFAKIHAPCPLETLFSTRTEVIEVACNWKAFLEVFNEYYRLPFVHPDCIGDVCDLPDTPEDVTGAYVTQFGATEGTGGLSHPDAQQGRFQPLLEPNVAGFARWFADKMIETL